MTYDDADYHCPNFTNPDTPEEWGGRVIAFYFAWALSRGLTSKAMAEVAVALQRGAAPVELLDDHCRGKLTDRMLSEEGNAFTAAYYQRDYYADYERVFDGVFAETGHTFDDVMSIPDTPVNLARMATLLDQRFALWKAGRLIPDAAEVFEVAERALTSLLAARDMGPATGRDWQEWRDLRGKPLMRLWGGDFHGGREWLFLQVLATDEGVGVHVNLSSRVDNLVREAWSVDLRPHLNPRTPRPDELLPLTAMIRMAAWWPGKLLKSREGPPASAVISRSELERLPGLLGKALAERGLPLLDQTHTAEGLGQLQRFGDPAKAVLNNSATSLVPLLSAEHAARPDLMALCDAWEATLRKQTVPPNVLEAGLLFVNMLRTRHPMP